MNVQNFVRRVKYGLTRMGYDPIQETWGFGYGFQKILYNKSSMLPTDGNNRKKQMSYGVKFYT